MARLDGKTAVITGGSSGIGLAAASAFAEEGARVIIAGRRASELRVALEAIGGDSVAIEADVSNLRDLDRLFNEVETRAGRIDILIASAGYAEIMPIENVTPEHFDATFNVNARGTFFTIQKALPLLVRGASVVLVSSSGHLKGIPVYAAYAATKAAQRSFGRSWAAALAAHGIRVNTLSPGFTDTPMVDRQANGTDGVDALKREMSQMTPLGRIGEASDMAKALLYLASDDSSFCTGIDLVVDGGLTQI